MDSRDTFRYDIDGLAEELEIDVCSLTGLFSSFVNEMEIEVSEMSRLLMEKDWNNLERVIHNIKGVCANLTIDDVFRQASEFHEKLKAGDSSEAAVYVESIAQMLKNAELDIKRYFSAKGLSI